MSRTLQLSDLNPLSSNLPSSACFFSDASDNAGSLMYTLHCPSSSCSLGRTRWSSLVELSAILG